MLKKIFVLFILALAFSVKANAQEDTLYVSHLYTTHILFSTDLSYVDISNLKIITGKIVETNKNMIAIRAREPFPTTASMFVYESNGMPHSYILKYDEYPKTKFIDESNSGIKEAAPVAADVVTPVTGSQQTGKRQELTRNVKAGTARKADAPKLSDVIDLPRQLYHLNGRDQKITFSCENIYSYSDITYVVLSLENKSGVSFEANDVTFVVESRKKGKRTIEFKSNLQPKSRYGNLTTAPGEYGKMVYSFDKLSLSSDRVLKAYLYEQNGQRNIEITIMAQDVNQASAPRVKKIGL